jgi:hypothetical protein
MLPMIYSRAGAKRYVYYNTLTLFKQGKAEGNSKKTMPKAV